jgi:hypothetical protein
MNPMMTSRIVLVGGRGRPTGEWFDPRFLDDLRRHAARVALRDGEHMSLNLGLEGPQ